MKYIIYEITPLNKSVLYSYVGSTKNFRTRKCHHKSRCYNENSKHYNLPVYNFIRENGGWDSFEMNPIEEIEVESKTQARIREQFWKENREAKFQVLNAYNPYSGFTNRTEYLKNYREENKQQINEKNTCPCGGKYTTIHKNRHLKTLKHLTFTQNCLTPTTL